ncbi:MAG: proline racemase family protein [Sphingomonas sp.]|jgi:trans-L-3-hydroxyproline dehydratase|uniref:proline racemase family protein n=1 Tax=Sphingomonas sp. TaxID=28214 RepID=UPI0035654257
MNNPFTDWAWTPHADWLQIETIDMHTGGEPLRVIVSGLPQLQGTNCLEKRRWFRDNLDHVRTALMWEPRGHADMYGTVMDRSTDGDFDVFFLHNEGYSTMCGHAILALTRLAAETGLVEPEREEIVFNVPCGRIVARPHWQGGRVASASFRNVPSYVALAGASVDVPGIGPVAFDIAYGGAYYALVEAAPLGLAIEPADHDRLIDHGRRIKHAVAAAFPVIHPTEPDLSFLYGTIFTGPPRNPAHHSRNVCIFADGEVDRSATGSGVSARAALHFSRGEIGVGEEIVIESILDTTMTVKVAETTRFGPHDAVIPQVRGSASFTGRNSFWIEPDDALRGGFLLR